LGSAKEARQTLQGDSSPCTAVVLMTTVKCRATRRKYA
jgi:hypothetical protein